MKLTVTMADGTTHDVQAENPDRVRYDMTRNKHGWPSAADAPFLMITFLAWRAMVRHGLYSGGWETFSETDCLDIDTDEAEAEAATNPTSPATVHDSVVS